MKKKLLMLLLALSCTFSMVACSKGEEKTVKDAFADEDEDDKEKDKEKESESETETETVVETEEETETETETEAETREPAASIPSELSDDLYDFQVSIDGTVYQFPMWYSDFEAMGWTYLGDKSMTLASNEYTFGDEWEKDGLTIDVQMLNLSMNTVDMTKSLVAGISFDKWNMEDFNADVILPGGIQYGVSTTDDIIAAYGEPTSDYEGDMYYELDYNFDYMQKVSFYVYHDTGVLEEIELKNFVELEGADNSIDTTVPDAVTEYVAPTELTDDYYSYNVEVYGDIYTLPCPVDAFLENGYVINEEWSDLEIGSGSYGRVTLERGDESLDLTVDNLAEYATIVENCFITSIRATNLDDEQQLIVPGNLTVGASEDEVLEVIEGFNYDVSELSGYTYYKIYAPDKSYLDSYEFVVEDKVVTNIYVDNSVLPE